MRYDLSMTLTQIYPGATNTARNAIRVMPLNMVGRQQVASSTLTVLPPPDERHERLDFFGNAVTDIAFRTPLDALSVSLSAQVTCRPQIAPAPEQALPMAQLRPYLRKTQQISPNSPHHFLAASPRIRLNDEMTSYASDAANPEMTVLEVARELGHRLFEDMSFDADATEVDTPAELAFAKRHGVCQDFSHIMITCLRGLGIPAGYVSGFLRTIPPEGQPRLEGADAMHAWVRVWCGPHLGWVEFDPTNDIFANTDHIVCAYGRDYSDVAPVKGVVRLAGEQSGTHEVDVVPLD